MPTVSIDHNSSGRISTGELYALHEFKRRLGLTDSAWRSLRRRGIPFVKLGKRVLLDGGAVIAFFQEQLTSDRRGA